MPKMVLVFGQMQGMVSMNRQMPEVICVIGQMPGVVWVIGADARDGLGL